MECEINEEHIKLSGDGFGMELKWEQVFKLEELKKWFMVYTDKKAAYIIPKHAMTAAEASEFRGILKSINSVSRKKLK